MFSSRRQKILDFIIEFNIHHGYTPTYDEIKTGCGINSVSSVQHHIGVLEQEGRILRNPRISRGIQIAKSIVANTVEVPLLGTIAAGEPIPVPNSDSWTTVPEEVLELPADLLQGKHQVFALKVKGISMIDALIDDGDIIVMETAHTAENGETVAVWLRDKQVVTLKKLFREPDHIRLQPANPLLKPILTSPDNVEIQGRLLAVIRKSNR